jgi:hypothetical protein
MSPEMGSDARSLWRGLGGDQTSLLVMRWDRTLGGDCGARGFLVKLGSERGKRPPEKPKSGSKKGYFSVGSDHQSLGSVWLAPSVFFSQLGGINSSKVSAWAAHVYLAIKEHGA